MGRTLRWIMRGTVALLALLALGLGAAWLIASRSLPQIEGRHALPALSAEVEVIRDAWGVPRIFALAEADAMRALGYVHAVDRLWQMDLTRRTVQGRLSERFGERTLETDRLMRALDLDGHAEASLGALSDEARAALEAYAEGVDARIAEAREGGVGRGAPEFYLFGSEIDDWTPADSLGVVKAMAFQISLGSLLHETARGRMTLGLEPSQVADLFPAYPGQEAEPLPRPARPSPAERPRGRRDAALGPLGLDLASMGGASSAWAVDGSRTAGRRPLLASDPHLPLTAPTIWYPVQLSAPGLRVMGASLPGVPAVAYGRNASVAWGLTATQLDDMDIFIERPGAAEGTYATPDGDRRFEERREVVRVRGGEDRELVLRRTRHGPVLPLSAAGLAAVTPEGHVPALAWTALADDDATFEALRDLNRARGAEAALAAAAKVVAPALNLVVADRETVGMAVAGRVPLRRITAPLQGRVPTPGWDGRGDWTGWLPASSLPREISPEDGMVANANNRVGERAFPRHLSFDWDTPYRIRRIEKLLGLREAHSVESFKAMQADEGSEMARTLLPLIAGPLWEGPLEDTAHPLAEGALSRLKAWDGTMRESGPEPLIFVAWLDALTARLTGDELGPLAGAYGGPRPLFLERVFRDIGGASRWCEDARTEGDETCDTVAIAALGDALEGLEARYGPEPASWRWGEAHPAIHGNRVLGGIGMDVLGAWVGLDSFVNLTHEAGGGDDTLLRGGMSHRGAQPYAAVHGAGYRGIYDFADPDRSVYVVSTGVSGNPLSALYANLAPLYRVNEYMPMSMDRRDFAPRAMGTLVLHPEDERP